ncbi:hypothetical protein HMPREF0762_00950 [Slackia exigua ATCC 700122]|uniref:Uncharacterized protein n=1 Tax=Slackia exigua (strain ATCC 700122 / DSM 15923 / CIP 105133 / JCM 11022 / KCTC 5966 / S-7) TaxID=649764 RepID=D0WGJ6_SLAES|nr:hypothetical protein HMPREF0762_00950 [Slackia exigua ATCC 700122]
MTRRGRGGSLLARRAFKRAARGSFGAVQRRLAHRLLSGEGFVPIALSSHVFELFGL